MTEARWSFNILHRSVRVDGRMTLETESRKRTSENCGVTVQSRPRCGYGWWRWALDSGEFSARTSLRHFNCIFLKLFVITSNSWFLGPDRCELWEASPWNTSPVGSSLWDRRLWSQRPEYTSFLYCLSTVAQLIWPWFSHSAKGLFRPEEKEFGTHSIALHYFDSDSIGSLVGSKSEDCSR